MLAYLAIPAAKAQGTCPGNVPTGVTKCYFIDYAGGSDSNSGTSETQAWQHAPTMANASGVPGSHTSSGGEGWIFKGGVTVDYHAFPMNVPWGGNASNPTYMGVDPNWYSGSAWARPIFNGGGAAGYHIDSRGFITDVEHQANYVIFDSLEFTGAYWNSDCGGAGVMYSCSYISTSSYTGSTNWEAKNIYAHGWSHGSSASDPGNNQRFFEMGENHNQASASSFHDSVIDGSDGTKDCCNGATAYVMYNNYFSYVNNFFFSGGGSNVFLLIHDNVMTHNVGSFGGGVHENCIHTFSNTSGTILIYNNYLDCPYTAPTQVLDMENDNTTHYVFNNVSIAGNYQGINPSATAESGNTPSQYYIFNNTSEAATDPDPTSACFTTAYTASPTYSNNFCISNNSGQPSVLSVSTSGTTTFLSPSFSITCSGKTQTGMGTSQICAPIGSGNGTGNLNATQTYPFAPMDSTAAAKVGAGQNNSSYCSKISQLNAAAGAACLSDTTLGVSYNSTNHTVSYPARQPLKRPSGNWTNGAYEPSSGTVATVSAPTSLQATVN